MMLSTELRPPPPQGIPHQTPTPPDSPIPSQMSSWFQPVDGQETGTQPVLPVRSTRHRRASVTVSRPKKRLFTPDIKRMLKNWLVRRRDNPYPSRAEKEALASATGLTYMQICNWFANWRRKLRKSANSGPSGTWGRLIKRYNATACAATAAEQFSISSGDSIWGADSSAHSDSEEVSGDHSYAPGPSNPARSRRRRRQRRRRRRRPPMQSATQGSTPLLSKWLESATKYRPSLPWATDSGIPECTSGRRHPAPEELDAAEALTRLSVVIGECHQCAALC